ncbi:hypothetical protein CWB99_14425 [Pseudoalteromonas rubra]|uniref:Orphan protein n=1 Tax=Pseudoalteromonas rubra TaxID=43658 RepID=A0A5S3WKE7_9GAMM|nr:DUF6702 family protein [Pseudoalteromonas rubra]TMP27643.1 hypothetical protein CWB99_14425 [Pseudoalteromonas rubra]TMP28874.1 hypothetical protein CWC00_20095 [Pseudoalteromonas rubra]
MKDRLIAALALIWANTAAAHQIKAAMTTVLIDPGSEQLELMHRFYLHDTEHAVEKLFGEEADLFQNASDRARFAEYVHDTVKLKDETGKTIPLTLYSGSIDGQFFWVTQRAPMPDVLNRLQMRHDALRDVWSEQVNMVNFKTHDTVHTLHFNGADGWLWVNFSK